ncbi:hypothetical protein BAUCODRAFT_189948 [Baudoinia panamericana UAMH 10762]|uniref:Uncharacterized protein n=1 Tax=Baudoinia panamericana (strain UAMH 10762) TaxID=717646 RepID=M2MVE7_BAUPA|nr:uncharacterized protein BAUCODRAFT_189948 [Baudoinia panamericana UAMH 10762]EMD00942.1 hypothetical protein BAUCODRAFT_189948 [Baudoinia panamericana UAMH 10762]
MLHKSSYTPLAIWIALCVHHMVLLVFRRLWNRNILHDDEHLPRKLVTLAGPTLNQLLSGVKTLALGSRAASTSCVLVRQPLHKNAPFLMVMSEIAAASLPKLIRGIAPFLGICDAFHRYNMCGRNHMSLPSRTHISEKVPSSAVNVHVQSRYCYLTTFLHPVRSTRSPMERNEIAPSHALDADALLP